MPITVQSGVENYVITPAPASPFGVPPASINQQQWMLVMTGVAILFNNGTQGVQGTLLDDWTSETVTITQDVATPLTSVITEFSIPPPAVGNVLGLSVSQWAFYVAISSQFADNTVDAGFAVASWRPTPFDNLGWQDGDGNVLNNIYQGIDVDIAVRNNSARIYGLSYQVTLVGLLAYAQGAG